MTRANPEILRLLPLDQVTSPKALREAFECIHPDPFEVDGAERVFRLHAAFQAEVERGCGSRTAGFTLGARKTAGFRTLSAISAEGRIRPTLWPL